MKMSTGPGPEGCGHRAARPQLPDIRRPAAVVKVERPEGPNDLDRGEDRGSVGLVAGATDRRAKSRTRDWKSCRAALACGLDESRPLAGGCARRLSARRPGWLPGGDHGAVGGLALGGEIPFGGADR